MEKETIWDYWYRIRPNRFYQGQGPETSTLEHWEEDLDLLLETVHCLSEPLSSGHVFSQKEDRSIKQVLISTVVSLDKGEGIHLLVNLLILIYDGSSGTRGWLGK